MVILTGGLLAYSQTLAWYPDEAPHLLAAQLINSGKRPYLDFFYQHTPFYAYMTAGWMRAFGESWRSAHLLAALLTGGCAALIAHFVYLRLGAAAAATSALLIALNAYVILFGTIGQPYALCLFLAIASYRLVIGAVSRTGAVRAFGAGACASAAAAASMLAAPIPAILLIWMIWHDQTGSRLRKSAWFLLGALIPFLPLLWLMAQAPGQVLFDVFEVSMRYRRRAFPGWNMVSWNLKALFTWFVSIQGLLLGLLAAVGWYFVAKRSGWEAERKAELYLCVWLTFGLGLYLGTPRPTFSQYFILVTPFAVILAAAGCYAVSKLWWAGKREAYLTIAVAGLYAIGLAQSLYDRRRYVYPVWQETEVIAREINRVTPSDGLLYAHEAAYFASGRTPPRGMENYLMQELRLPPEIAGPRQITSHAEIREWLEAGRFATVLIESDDWSLEKHNWRHFYAQRKRFPTHTGSWYLLWDRIAPAATSTDEK